MKYNITDSLWEEIKSIIPMKKNKVGRPELDRRKCLETIFWILRTGAQWASIPRFIAPHTTIHGKFRKWVKLGVMEKAKAFYKAFYLDKNPGWEIWFAEEYDFSKYA